jgi:hypothetical protein
MTEAGVGVLVREPDWLAMSGCLPPDLLAECCASPQRLAILARMGAKAAVIDESLCDDALSTQLMGLACDGVPRAAIQVVRERGARRERRAPWAADVLHVNDCRTRLWRVMRRRVIEWRLARGAVAARARYGDADEVCNAIDFALRTSRPFTTITEWARASGTNRATLYKRWRAVFNRPGDFTPLAFLHHVLLLRGLAVCDVRGIGERAVAKRLGVARSTLRAASHATTGLSFSRVATTLVLTPVRDFESRFL